MYLGHYAIALAAKRASPNTSLGTLIAASQLIDIIWPLLVLVGLEKVTIDPGNTVVTPLHFVQYPFTHSLLSVLIWASFFASLYWMISSNRTGTLTVWLAVLSHWVLDFFTHAPDLPLYPGSEKVVGLGLWNSLSGTLMLELGMFIVGMILYLRTTRPANRTGTYSFVLLIVFLLVTYFMNILGPPPPDYRMVAYSALLLWLLVPWGYWIDRNRHSKIGSGGRSTKLKYKGKRF
jgi:membrane-bound metal-dependent hydrolase YbcI (DUF457 family)